MAAEKDDEATVLLKLSYCDPFPDTTSRCPRPGNPAKDPEALDNPKNKQL